MVRLARPHATRYGYFFTPALSLPTLSRFAQVYVKHVLNHVPMSTWTRVYYNNALALFMCPPFLLVGSEYARLGAVVERLRRR